MKVYVVRMIDNDDFVCVHKTFEGAWKCAVEVLKEIMPENGADPYDKEEMKMLHDEAKNRVNTSYVYIYIDETVSIMECTVEG